jgi:phage gp29-like protein
MLAPTELAGVMDAAVNRLGVKVPLAWAHEALGIPQAGEADATVPGASR